MKRIALIISIAFASITASAQNKTLDVFNNIERVTESNHRTLLDTGFVLTKSITGTGKEISTRQSVYFYRNVDGDFIKFCFDRGTLYSVSTTNPKFVAEGDGIVIIISTKELTRYYRGQN